MSGNEAMHEPDSVHTGRINAKDHECDKADNDESDDFIHSYLLLDDNNNNNKVERAKDIQDTASKPLYDHSKQTDVYQSRKPHWWNSISGRPTASQRKAIRAMESHRLSQPALRQKHRDGTNNSAQTSADKSTARNVSDKTTNCVYWDWQQVFSSHDFDNNSQQVGLEIGFGTGENLLALARLHSNVCWIGAEVYKSGVGRLCQRMQRGITIHEWWNGGLMYKPGIEADLRANPDAPMTPIDQDDWIDKQIDSDNDREANSPYDNLRFYIGDGVKMLPCIPSNSLDFVLLTFPDPFPKPHQSAWRVMQNETLLQLHRVLKSNHGFFYLATDHPVYREWCESLIQEADMTSSGQPAWQEVLPCPDRSQWLPVVSKYEQKGWLEGRQTMLACWRCIESDSNVNDG
jgi:tRNA (guanine-N7-)-methyltransferase